MNKRLLYGIITLLAFTMTGILGFQYFWLKNTIRLETESFDRKVYDITQRVNQRLEEKEARDMVKTDITRLIAKSEPTPIAAPQVSVKKAVANQPSHRKSKATQNERDLSSVQKEKEERFAPFGSLGPEIQQPDFQGTPELLEFDRWQNIKELEPLLQLGLTNHLEINNLLKDIFPEIIIQDSQIVMFNHRGNKLPTIDFPALKRLDSLRMRKIKAVNQQVAKFLQPDFIQDCTARCVEEEVRENGLFSNVRFSYAGPVKGPSAENPLTENFNLHKKVGNENSEAEMHKRNLELERKQAEEKARLKAKALDLEMKKVMVNYFAGQKDVKDRIDSAEIQNMLERELKKSGIDIPFDFAVFRGVQPIYRTAGLQNEGADEKIYMANLFTSDVVDSKLRLALVFPNKDSYIIQNLFALVWVSGTLSLLILTAFFASGWALLRQKKVSDIKSDFINNMTHEFKTPIATISLATDALNNPKVIQDQGRIQYYSGIIREENKRMNKQVEKVLQMAQLERKDLQLNTEALCIHDVIQQAVSMLSLQVEDRGGKISTYFSADQCFTQADEVHMANVFFNLIDNANKYSDTQPEINLYTFNHQDRIIIEISDNGKGMKPETIRHCFDKFYRESTGNRHDVKGFGLGLSYVKEIIDMHQGDIRVKSEINKGTTFEISLPLCKTNRI